MQFITGQPRRQTYFATLEDQVAADLIYGTVYSHWHFTILIKY